MAFCTRARDSGETSSGLLRTFETVPTDTPASCATSRILVVGMTLLGSEEMVWMSVQPGRKKPTGLHGVAGGLLRS